MAGKIYRRKKSSEFVTLDTHCLKNKELKWDAKGLHSYLVQLPEDWQINIADLVNRSKDGRDATTSPMKALIEAGYVVREMCFDCKGKFDGYDYFVFERPEHAEEWKTVNGKTVNGKTVNGKTVNGKPATTKNEDSLIENSKNEESVHTPAPAESESSTLEAEIPQPPKVAPKGSAPAESEDPTHLVKTYGPENPGVMEVEGITLPVEPPKPIQPWEYPNAASPKELKSTLLRYAAQEPDNWRDNVLEVGRATSWTSEKIDECLTDFCAWQFRTDNVKAKLGQYTAGFSLWLKSQKRFDRAQPGASAQPSQRANLNALGSNQAAYLEKALF